MEQDRQLPDAERESGDQNRGGGPPRLLALLLLAPVLYVLSTGPVIRLCLIASPKRVPQAVDIAYKPLEWSYNHSDIAKEFFDWYFHVCGVK